MILYVLPVLLMAFGSCCSMEKKPPQWTNNASKIKVAVSNGKVFKVSIEDDDSTVFGVKKAIGRCILHCSDESVELDRIDVRSASMYAMHTVVRGEKVTVKYSLIDDSQRIRSVMDEYGTKFFKLELPLVE